MNTVHAEFAKSYEDFKHKYKLKKGRKVVSINRLVELFEKFAPHLPVTKHRLGRSLTQDFLKVQDYVFEEKAYCQCYLLNQDL